MKTSAIQTKAGVSRATPGLVIILNKALTKSMKPSIEIPQTALLARPSAQIGIRPATVSPSVSISQIFQLAFASNNAPSSSPAARPAKMGLPVAAIKPKNIASNAVPRKSPIETDRRWEVTLVRLRVLIRHSRVNIFELEDRIFIIAMPNKITIDPG